LRYVYKGTDLEGSGSGLINFLSRRAEENHEKSHLEQAIFSTQNTAATPPAQCNYVFVI